jgi:hypothetical protein
LQFWEPGFGVIIKFRPGSKADFRIGGLDPGETKTALGKLYLMSNYPDVLLARYAADFGVHYPDWRIKPL